MYKYHYKNTSKEILKICFSLLGAIYFENRKGNFILFIQDEKLFWAILKTKYFFHIF